MKPRSPKKAERAVQDATEAVIQSGNTVIEEKIWDAHEAALDGQPHQFLADIISGKAEGPYSRRRVVGEMIESDLRVENAVFSGALWLTANALKAYHDAAHSEIDDAGVKRVEVLVFPNTRDKATDASCASG